MRRVLVDWTLVEDACVRMGWGLGWFMGILIGVLGLMSGGAPELTAVRAVLALMSFALLGWLTGMLVGRFAPSSVRASQPQPAKVDQNVGTKVDRTVGDEVAWPDAVEGQELTRGSSAA